VLTAIAGSVTPTAEVTPEVTPTVSDQLPDLAIGTTPTVSDGKLFITVINQGQGDAVGDIVVAVFNEDGSALIGGATLPGFTLKPGRSIDIGTGYEVTESQTVLLIVDPNGDMAETDDTNNRATVAIAVGNPPPTQEVPGAETPTEPVGIVRP
jgi:subtilase family serine protease